MIKKLFIFGFLFVSIAYAQKSVASKNLQISELAKFRQDLIKSGKANDATLSSRINLELQNMKKLRQPSTVISEIYLLVDTHRQISSTKKEQLAKVATELEQFKKILSEKNWVLSEADGRGHTEILKKYGIAIADPNRSEDFWVNLEGTPFYMKNDIAAQLIYERLISVRTDLGQLASVFNTSKKWVDDKRANADFNFEALYKVTDLETGAADDVAIGEAFKKMDISKKVKEVRIVLLQARINYKKGEFQKCEEAISPVVAEVSNTENSRNFHYRAKDYLARCLLAQKKIDELKKLYSLPISRALEAVFLVNPTRKLMSDMRFQINLGKRKDAFDTCTALFSYANIQKPFFYSKFLTICYALKAPGDVWPEFLVSKYSKDLPVLMEYSKKSPEISEFIQLMRNLSSNDKSEKAKSLKGLILKKYGADDLLSLAIALNP